MIDADTDNVDAKVKADAPDASRGSKIDIPKIDVMRWIGKMCEIMIALSQCFSFINQALRDAQSAGECTYTGKFHATIDAKKETKKEATKSDAKQKSNAILTSRHVTLRQKSLRETQNCSLGGGYYSGTGWKETKQKIRVGQGGGKDKRQVGGVRVSINTGSHK